MGHATVAIAAALLSVLGTAGCAAQPAEPPLSDSSASILASSSPAAGSTVHAPESLRLRFDPPARLDEVKITGPGGTMPMMIHSVGEVADYDLPLSGLSPGSYSVEWQATVGGRPYSGHFNFTVAQ
jgi:methionine-rich copper-binding protein CopC